MTTVLCYDLLWLVSWQIGSIVAMSPFNDVNRLLKRLVLEVVTEVVEEALLTTGVMVTPPFSNSLTFSQSETRLRVAWPFYR